jgi:hypothetical protein
MYPSWAVPEECGVKITSSSDPVAAYAGSYLSSPHVYADQLALMALTDVLQCRACLVEAGRCTWYPAKPDSSHSAGRDIWVYRVSQWQRLAWSDLHSCTDLH